MFARNIRVTNPLLAVAPGWREALGGSSQDQVELNRKEVMVIWRALFDPRDPICTRAEGFVKSPQSRPPEWTANVQVVTRWICGHDDRRATPPLLPDYQVEAWGNVIRELGRIQP